jgi:hypothetical protein
MADQPETGNDNATSNAAEPSAIEAVHPAPGRITATSTEAVHPAPGHFTANAIEAVHPAPGHFAAAPKTSPND